MDWILYPDFSVIWAKTQDLNLTPCFTHQKSIFYRYYKFYKMSYKTPDMRTSLLEYIQKCYFFHGVPCVRFIFFSFYLTNFSYKEENKTFSKTIVLAFLAQKKNSNADRFHTLKIILRATITASNIYLEQTHVISVNYTRVSV